MGTSGPSSRSIFKASPTERGCRSVRCEMEPAITTHHPKESTYRRNRGDRKEREEERLLGKVVHTPDDALSTQVLHVEVEQQAEPQTRNFQVRHELSLVNPVEARDRLDLQNN